MKALTRWFLDNPVAANLLMVFTLVAGWLSFQDLRVESFPQIPPTELEISVIYPGGTANQVDNAITQRIEESISGVAGIKSITSSSSRGYASVVVKKNTGVLLDRLMEDVRNQVDSIEGFPALAERPRIYRREYTNLAAFVMVSGHSSEALLQELSTRVENALKKHPAISKVTNLGKRKRLLVVEPDAQQLQRYGLDVTQIAQRIDQWSLEYRSGELRTARGNIQLRGSDYADNLVELKRIPVLATGNTSILLGDIATVKRDYEKTDAIVRYQGKPAIALMVSTSQKDNLFDISEAIESVLVELRPTLPQGMQLDVMADMSPYIAEQLDLLGSNAVQGLLIVLLLLGLFLNLRLAFWVALGIPISVAGAVAVMGLPAMDYSLNDITLFGMILVLGILVDDAVVVGESIHQARQTTVDPKEAAWKGVETVAIPTIFGVLTTIAAFSPMLWIENELAKVLAGFSAVVIFALCFSLVESKFILPSHLSYVERPVKAHWFSGTVKRARTICNHGLDWFSSRVYLPVLSWSMNNRMVTLMLFSTFAVLAYGALLKGHIGSVFFPEIPGRYATVTVTMQHDAPQGLAQRNTHYLESALNETALSLQKAYELEDSPVRQYVVAMEGAHEIELTAELSPGALAEIPSHAFLAELRQHNGNVEGSYAVNYTLAEEPAGGTAIAIAAPSRDEARAVANRLRESLKLMPGVDDVYDDSQTGKRELKITLTERGVQLGLDQRRLAALVGGGFGHVEVHRVLDNNQETQVLVRLPEAQAKTIEQLKATSIMLAKDQFVRLGEVSRFEYSREPEVLYRRDRNQVVTVYWRQNRSISSPEQTWERLQAETVPALEATYPGVAIEAVGEFSEIMEVQQGFKKAMLLTLLLIYVLLAIPLRSYWQPLVIMAVIPFGFAGAMVGHAVMELSVSLLSLFGMMAMTGVVINDSLVLMTRFNQLRETGMMVVAALLEAGKSRLRAIFLTTATTVCGLLPLLSETSEQAQYLKPAAVSLVFGELFATAITLVLIPVLLSFVGKKARDSKAPVSSLSNQSHDSRMGTAHHSG